MKSKNGHYKMLYQNIKKRREKQKNTSQKSESQINDDSLDLNQKTPQKPIQIKTQNNQEINQEDLKELRTCISNQFKKSNFINFSVIKNQSNNTYFQSESKILNQISDTETKHLIHPQNDSKGHLNKRNFLSSHNRSQSCPFIQPLSIYDNVSLKEGKTDDLGIVFSSIKVEKDQKKKISMQYLTKNRYKFMNTTGNTQSKVFNHNYSNSLTQSSNTVIVHNIPNQAHQSIIPNENLSSILYKKVQEEEETKTQKQKSKPQKVQNSSYIKVNEQKNSGRSQKTLQKKSLTQVCVKHDFYIKTKIQQRITRYQLKQEQQKHDIDTRAMNIKDIVLQKLLLPYGNKKFQEQAHQNSSNSMKESIIMNDRENR